MVNLDRYRSYDWMEDRPDWTYGGPGAGPEHVRIELMELEEMKDPIRERELCIYLYGYDPDKKIRYETKELAMKAMEELEIERMNK